MPPPTDANIKAPQVNRRSNKCGAAVLSAKVRTTSEASFCIPSMLGYSPPHHPPPELELSHRLN